MEAVASQFASITTQISNDAMKFQMILAASWIGLEFSWFNQNEVWRDEITLVSTCICTDWQLMNSTAETTLSNTTLVFLHESSVIEFTLPDVKQTNKQTIPSLISCRQSRIRLNNQQNGRNGSTWQSQGLTSSIKDWQGRHNGAGSSNP